ncbi:hypothetical protein D9757_009313 [Collybiopsis confluens]|uniref:Zn(2)-C6 fungal-type domain-containing protein n=1 Tax=Collybiopsis confluens TaxID=2823264 RepID=A0A8H5H3B6_9AGAR|nr:hypothetical protein D9757_009313 [Collybiopsis confluens]
MKSFGPGSASGSFHSFPQINRKEKDNIKRSLGQISCAECRRLKLRCDKNIPCGSCVRRKCEFLCPTETLPSLTKGKRETTESATLSKNIESMMKRIRQLEDALATLQATVSTEPHPLLKDKPTLLPEIAEKPKPRNNDSEGVDSLDALGTLTLSELGDARYLGRSAGPERLFEQSPGVSDTSPTNEINPPPSQEIAKLVNSFPFVSDGTWDVDESIEILQSYLPREDQAWALAETFSTQTYFKLDLVSKEELYDELLTPVYEYISGEETRAFPDVQERKFPLPPSRLAVLFLCLAHGALTDLERPMFNTESEMYFNLARASLALHPVFSHPDLACVQALALAGLFQYMGGQSYNVESAWLFTALAAKLAHAIGLHYESPRWGMDQKTLHRRRAIYWDIHSLDMILSQGLGRPHSVTVAHGDTPFPEDEEQDRSVDAKGNPEPGFARWRMAWFKDIVAPFHDLALSPRMPDYQRILELEQRIQRHPPPKKYETLLSQSSGPPGEGQRPTNFDFERQKEQAQAGSYQSEYTITAIKSHQLTQLREAMILYVHRAFFVQALLQSPSDPSKSVYAPSFLAAYRSASKMIYVNVQYFYNYSEILLRFWTLWTGILSAGIVLGMIVIRCPTSVFAEHAFAKLGLALELFRVGATRSDRAKRGLNTLLLIHEKANEAYNSARSQANSPQDAVNMVQEDAEARHTLEMFVGYTKLLVKNMKPSYARDDSPTATTTASTSAGLQQGGYSSPPPPTGGAGPDSTTTVGSIPEQSPPYLSSAQQQPKSHYSPYPPPSHVHAHQQPIPPNSSLLHSGTSTPTTSEGSLNMGYPDPTQQQQQQPVDRRMFSYAPSSSSSSSGNNDSRMGSHSPADVSSGGGVPSHHTHQPHLGYTDNSPMQYTHPHAYSSSSTQPQYHHPHHQSGSRDNSWNTNPGHQGQGQGHQGSDVFIHSTYSSQSHGGGSGGANQSHSGVASAPMMGTPIPLTMSVGAMNAQWVEMMQDVGVYRRRIAQVELALRKKDPLALDLNKRRSLYSDLLELYRPGYRIRIRTRAFCLIMEKIAGSESFEDVAFALVDKPLWQSHDLLLDILFSLRNDVSQVFPVDPSQHVEGQLGYLSTTQDFTRMLLRLEDFDLFTFITQIGLDTPASQDFLRTLLSGLDAREDSDLRAQVQEKLLVQDGRPPQLHRVASTNINDDKNLSTDNHKMTNMRMLPSIIAQHAFEGASSSSKFIEQQLPPLVTTQRPHATRRKTSIEVINGETLMVTRRMMDTAGEDAQGKTAVLSLASHDQLPSMGWTAGFVTQEESLCFCSTLWHSLGQANIVSCYPWPDTGPGSIAGIFSEGVVIFRQAISLNSEMDTSDYTHNPERIPAVLAPSLRRVISVISVAAPVAPELTFDGEDFASDQVREEFMEKIRLILRMAGWHGKTFLVLGALGCGRRACPPTSVARLMKSVLLEKEFEGWFARIVFAVLGSGGEDIENFEIFQDVLAGVEV